MDDMTPEERQRLLDQIEKLEGQVRYLQSCREWLEEDIERLRGGPGLRSYGI